jgi:hypothetical protein
MSLTFYWFHDFLMFWGFLKGMAINIYLFPQNDPFWFSQEKSTIKLLFKKLGNMETNSLKD